MESLTERLRWRKTSLKPIQITKRDPETIIINHINGTNISQNNDNGEEEPLSPASRLYHEPTFNVYVIAVMGFKNPINLPLFYEKLQHVLRKHRRLSSLQVVDDKNGGRMKWVPTTVNLNNHIIIPTIPQTLHSPDKFLEDYVSNLSKTSIDSSKPMWDLHLLNLKTTGAEAAVILHIHHSLGDGISLMSMFTRTGQICNPNVVPTIPTKKNSGWFSYYGSRSDGGRPSWHRWFMKVCMDFWLVWNTLVDLAYVMATIVFLKDTKTPLKAPAGAEVNPRRVVHRILSLDDMRIIKNAMNTTINDVALAIIQAGLSRYLDRKYGPEGEDEGTTSTEKKNNLSKRKIRLRGSLVVNIRPSLGIQIPADMMDKDTEVKWGNSVSYVLLPFTIGIKDDPLDYVRQVKAKINRKKQSLEAFYLFHIFKLGFKLFGIKASNLFANKVFTHTTLMFSNMVGPREEIDFCGHTLEYLAPSSYGQPHGLHITLQSYLNKMTLALSVDESIITDPHKLLDDLEDSLKLIKEAVYAKGLVQEV